MYKIQLMMMIIFTIMMTIMLVMIVHGDKFDSSVFNDRLFYRLYHTASR